MAVLSEFALIKQFFTAVTADRQDVVLGIGDDCALLRPPAGKLLATSVDTLVAGRHFFADVDPYRLGHKALAVNLSDLAAMGAEPAWFTLALTLPEADEQWLEKFAAGMADLASRYDIQLIGGDTTRGPLSITIQATGFVDECKSLRRNAAQPGDWILVSGTLGDAGAGLKILQDVTFTSQLSVEQQQYCLNRLECPAPRNDLTTKLAGAVHAAIDISDGLLADLKHILKASNVGATLDIDQLPLSLALQSLPVELAVELALTAGDDYELCFTASPENARKLMEKLADQVTCIGTITTAQHQIKLSGDWQQRLELKNGYDHFEA